MSTSYPNSHPKPKPKPNPNANSYPAPNPNPNPIKVQEEYLLPALGIRNRHLRPVIYQLST